MTTQHFEYKHLSGDSLEMEIALNEVAKEGWELINIYPSVSGATHVAWLKRPATNESDSSEAL